VLDLLGGTAVVTGGAGGIGQALAAGFAHRGMRIVLADFDEAALENAVDALSSQGAAVAGVPTDVSDPTSVDALAARTISLFGRVDVVCNNAGIVVSGLSWEVAPQRWQQIMSVNFMGVVHGIRSFVPALREQNSGHVVNTCSMAGVMVGPGMGPYAASKHAVIAVSEALFKELRSEGSAVGVSVVCPGMVDTAMPARSLRSAAETADGPAATLLGDAVRSVSASAIAPGQVADCVLDAVDSDRFWVFTHPDRMDAVIQRAHDMVDGSNPSAAYL
jgi:NAD(P)-dependent dehydrogenase (short-subunit alcohol dehydrogenase family)